MSEWRTTTLGEVVTLQRGHDLPEAQRTLGQVPVIGSAGPNGWHNVAKVEGPGVTVGRSGASAGVVTFVPTAYWPHNTVLYVKDFKRNDPRFISYLLRTLPLAELNSGSAQPSLNRNFLYHLGVRIPAPAEQRRIAGFLSAYDDLIELNRRRIALLEEIARAVFEEWFVRFRFPGHEVVTIAEPPDGPLPEGWSAAELGDVCLLMQSGSTPSRGEPAYWKNGTIDWYSTGELRDEFLIASKERISERAVADKVGRVFPPDTILMAIYGSPTVGRLGVTTVPCSTNQAALAMRPDPERVEQWVLYYTLWSLRARFNSMSQGAAQQNISKQKVSTSTVKLPPRRLQEQFQQVVDPLKRMQCNLQLQIRSLAGSRDLLLPRLINGDLSIAAAERAVEDAATSAELEAAE